jgi:ribulose-phosphate 3-epimerase
MPMICPTILAATAEDYEKQVKKVAHLAHRIQIDLTDRLFAAAATVKPEQAWWPVGVKADIHLMYKNPKAALKPLLEHKPHLIIIHAEADGDFEVFAERCRSQGVKVGVALLQKTSPQVILPALDKIDHVLIFSGDLGKFNGHANTGLLSKVHFLKNHKPSLEIGWDGGINDQNISQLAFGGVDVFNVGGYLQGADDPGKAFKRLQRIAEETGTT